MPILVHGHNAFICKTVHAARCGGRDAGLLLALQVIFLASAAQVILPSHRPKLPFVHDLRMGTITDRHSCLVLSTLAEALPR